VTDIREGVLWVPGPLPGLNELIEAAKGSGGKGMRYAALKRDWTMVIAGLARRAKLPALTGMVFFRFNWTEPDRRRDPDNVAGGGRKLILDGLVAAGVLRGDGWATVHHWADNFAVGPVPGCRVFMAESVCK
jgi:hypothetical protein